MHNTCKYYSYIVTVTQGMVKVKIPPSSLSSKSYMHHGKDFCPSHRIRETELDARVQQYAEAVRNQWIAEQANLQLLY